MAARRTRLEDLETRLTADSRPLESGLRRGERAVASSSRKNAQSWGRFNTTLEASTSRLLKLGAAFLGVAGLAGLARFTSQTLAANEAQLFLAQRLGLSTRQLQEYQFIAEQTGIEQNVLALGVQRFGRRVGEATLGMNTLLPLLDEMTGGVRGVNGEVRPAADLFDDFIDGLRRMENPLQRNAVAAKVFDSEALKFVQILQDSTKGTKEYREAFAALNLEVGGEILQSSANARTAISELNAQFSAASRRAIGSWSESIENALGNSATSHIIANAIAVAEAIFTVESASTGRSRERFDELRESIAAVEKQSKALTDSLGLAQAFEDAFHGFINDDDTTSFNRVRQANLLAAAQERLARAGAAIAAANASRKKFGPITGGAAPDLSNLETEATRKARLAAEESAAQRLQATFDRQAKSFEDFQRRLTTAQLTQSDDRVGLILLEEEAWIASLDRLTITEEQRAQARLAIASLTSEKIAALLTETEEEGDQFAQSLQESVESAAEGAGRELTALALTGEAAFKRLGLSLVNDYLSKFLLTPGLDVLSGFGGSLLSGIGGAFGFAGAKATHFGGSVSAGKPVSVAGQEYFVPATSGAIVSAGLSQIGPGGGGGGGFDVKINVVTPAGIPVAVSSSGTGENRALQLVVADAIGADIARNGPVTQVITTGLNVSRGVRTRG